MRITIALICALVSALFAILLAMWLRGKQGSGREIAKISAIVKGRSRNFRSFQIIPVVVSVVVVIAALGIGINWKQAGACLAGAVAAAAALAAGSASFSSGITASYNEALNGDIRQSVRAGYRTGAIMGLWIAGIILAVLCGGLMILKTDTVIKYSASFALGALVITMVLHTSGEVYTSAYSLAVPSKDFTDRTGAFIAAGSDFTGSYVLAAVSAILLAEQGVASSGVASSFNVSATVRFPLLVYGAGIIGTVIGILIHRAGLGNDLSKGSGAGCLAAGIITGAASVYLSMNMLQMRVYSYALLVGIAAALVMSSISRVFSSDSRIFLNGYKTDRSLGKHSSVIFSLGSGMMSTAIFAVIFVAAASVSYMFASYYGIALAAVGMTSVFGSMAGVTGIVSGTSTVSDIIASGSPADDSDKSVISLLDSVSTRNLVSVRTFACISGMMTSFAAFSALFYAAQIDTIDLLSMRVFGGIITGACAAFILSGLLISSVRITGRVALRDIGKNDDDTGATSALRGALLPAFIAIAFPTVVGLLAGIKALAGFIIASVVTGYVIITCINNSGMHYENTAVQSLSSLLKMMAVFSIAFIPVFMKVGGFLFQ